MASALTPARPQPSTELGAEVGRACVFDAGTTGDCSHDERVWMMLGRVARPHSAGLSRQLGERVVRGHRHLVSSPTGLPMVGGFTT